jgi:hypothetical protein
MRAIIGFLIPALLLTLSSTGAEESKNKKVTKRDPKVLQLVKQAADLCKNAKSLHAELDVGATIQNGDETQEFQAHCTCDLEQPSRFALRSRQVKNKDLGLDFISDGKTLLVHSLRLKQYTQSAAPKKLADLGERLARLGKPHSGFFIPNLLTEVPYESLMDDIISCTYAGKEKVGDHETHHVKVVHPEVKWELWIAAQPKPMVLKATSLVAVDEYRATTVETFTNWKFDEAPEQATFTITPPAGATKVDVLGAPRR